MSPIEVMGFCWVHKLAQSFLSHLNELLEVDGDGYDGEDDGGEDHPGPEEGGEGGPAGQVLEPVQRRLLNTLWPSGKSMM